MNDRILLVDDDHYLLQTRVLILDAWNAEIVGSREAVQKLMSETFAIVIIGQSVPRPIVNRLIDSSRQLVPSPSLLVLRYAEDMEELGAETYPAAALPGNPGWLKQRVKDILATRSATPQREESSRTVAQS